MSLKEDQMTTVYPGIYILRFRVNVAVNYPSFLNNHEFFVAASARDRVRKAIVEWCTERYGLPHPAAQSNWTHDGEFFFFDTDQQAFEFKMRWHETDIE
ncbi:MAG: hypothetical protein EOP83_01590 [Verrucomicrobiaceae bacterium]|nr:MAG: hypothetical protein EOP83_01590 [Verrucomicrobiaceae bacterium]